MFGISLLLMLRKTPRFLMMILLFIVVFLLAFLLVGCTQTSSTFSGVYLAEFKFNSSSAMYPLIEEAYEKKGNKSLAQMKVRANYLGICVEMDDSISCNNKNNYESFDNFTGVSFFNPNSNSTSTTLNLVTISSEYANKVIKPYVLVATLILSLVLFLNLLYCSLAFMLPFSDFATKFSVILSSVTLLVWGAGCMWNQIGGNSVKYLIEPSSMSIVTSSLGNRARSMSWASFAFLAVVTLGCFYLLWRDRRKNTTKEKPSGGRNHL